MKVIFDTNLWISFMIGRRLSSLSDILNRSDIEIFVTPQLLDEIKTVIDRPKFEKLISQGTRCFFWDMVDDVCHNVDITIEAVSPIRDIKDLYLLSLAETVPVDYLISGDKDLTVLKEHAGIPILTYAEFLQIVGL